MNPQAKLTKHVLAAYRELREGAGLCFASRDQWKAPGLIELKGQDRMEWLQGQATNDVRVLESGRSVDFCICLPTGQILAVCTAWAKRDRILIATDRVRVEAVLRRAEQMVVMEDVAASDLTPVHAFVSLQGPAWSQALDDLLASLRVKVEDVLAMPSDRCGRGGVDLWIPRGKGIPPSEASVPATPLAAWNIARLEAGIPVFSLDINERTLPPEMGPAFESRHVSYAKGCYVGQEVLHRIHARGHTNRTWVGLLCEAPVSAGDPVSSEVRAEAGIVTSAAISPEWGAIAAAMLRNEAAIEGARVVVRTNLGEVPARVRAMPLGRAG